MQLPEEEECARKQLRFELCQVIEQPILWRDLAARMIRKMGLDKFIFDTRVPALEEDLCCEFIRSFSQAVDGKVGTVRGQRIVLCAESLRDITGLPLGESRTHPSPDEYVKALINLFPRKRKSEHGYYLPDIVVENRDEFIAIAVMLMQKLMCSSKSGKYTSPSIVQAMSFSITKRVSYPWAWFMCEQMQEAVLRSRDSQSIAFPYGEWLSGVIRHQMRREAENQRGKTLKAAKTDQKDKSRRKAVKRKYQGDVEPVAPRSRAEQGVQKVEVKGREETKEQVGSAKPEKGFSRAGSGQQDGMDKARSSGKDGAVKEAESGKLGAELGLALGAQQRIGEIGEIEKTEDVHESATQLESAKLENDSGGALGVQFEGIGEIRKLGQHEAGAEVESAAKLENDLLRAQLEGIGEINKLEQHEAAAEVESAKLENDLRAAQLEGIGEIKKLEQHEAGAEAESPKLENESGAAQEVNKIEEHKVAESAKSAPAAQEVGKTEEHDQATITSKNAGDDTAQHINSKNAGDDTVDMFSKNAGDVTSQQEQQEQRLKLMQLRKDVREARCRNATVKLEWEAKIADLQKLKDELEEEHELDQRVQTAMEELQGLEENNRLTTEMRRAFEAGKDKPVQSLKQHLELYTNYKQAIALLKRKLSQGQSL